MQRRIAVHVLFLSALSQFIVSCPGQYLGDGFGSEVVSGMAGTGGGLDPPRASVMSPGSGGSTEGLGPKQDYDSGIGMQSSSTQVVYPLLVGRYGVGQGLGYGSEVGPSYGRYGTVQGLGYSSEVGPSYGRYGTVQGLGYASEVGPSYGRYGTGQGLGYTSEVGPSYGRYGTGQGLGYTSEVGPSYGRYGTGPGLGYGSEVGPSYSYVGGMASSRDYAGGMDPGFGYGGAMGTPGASAMAVDGSNSPIGSKYPPNLGYSGPLSIANTGTLGAGVTPYPMGGLSYAPVYPSMMIGSVVPSPQQRAVLNANENTNTNVNINNNMGKHRSRLIGKGLFGTPQA